MRLAAGKFKFMRIFPSVALGAAALLSGCATAPTQVPQPAQQQPLAQVRLDSDDTVSRTLTQALSGEFALDRGDVATASHAWADVAELSNDPRAAERSAQLALAGGDRQGAAQAIERMQAAGADPAAVLREHARLALLKGHRDEARDDLRQMLEPGSRDAWGEVAQLLSSARDPALAGTLLEELATPADLPQDDASIWVAMSQLATKLQRHRYAEQIADAAVARFDNVTSLAWAAHMKLENGNAESGKALFRRALEREPDNRSLRFAFGSALGKLGENKAAAALLAQGPQDLDTFTARAAFSARADDDAALRRIYDELERAAPSIGDAASFLLGQLADARDDAGAAIGWYARVPEDDEHYFDASARRAVLLSRQGGEQVTEAHALTARLVQDSEGDEEALARALLLDAQIYTSAGDTAGAIAAYDRALARLPDTPELLYGRALSLADAGRADASIADLRALLKLQPDDVDAMNALGYTLADGNRQLDEAEALLRRALAAKPDEPAVIDSWGWLQYRQGRLDEAEVQLRRAWDAQKDPDIGAHLGEVLWRLGKHDEARAIFAAVEELDPGSSVLQQTLQRLEP